jgi:hypothetical protein
VSIGAPTAADERMPDLSQLIRPSPYTLRGGAPAWLAEPVTAEDNEPPGKGAGYSYTNTLIVPWSKVVVLLVGPGPQQQLLDSISVTPSPAPDVSCCRTTLPRPARSRRR